MKEKTMDHTISGHNFHGRYSLTLRGPAKGFRLSPAQIRKYDKAICGMADCCCGGGYGDGPDLNSARIECDGFDHLRLIPAKPDAEDGG